MSTYMGIGIKEDKFTKEELKSVENCLTKHEGRKIMLRKYLGSGEQGTAFLDDDGRVTKVTKLLTERNQKIWEIEVLEGEKLGQIEPQIAPRIFDKRICDFSSPTRFFKLGIIQMETLVMADKGAKVGSDADLAPIRVKTMDAQGFYEVDDNLTNMTHRHQIGFIQKFLILARHGYIHMDNHIENLGYVVDTTRKEPVYNPILFDFGFIQKFEASALNILFALAFSCFIILEHDDLDTIDQTLFLRLGVACLFGSPDEKRVLLHLDSVPSQTISTLLESTKRFSMHWISSNFNSPNYKDTIKKIRDTLRIVFGVNENDSALNIKVGALISLFILKYPKEDRYELEAYSDLFYGIRQNNFRLSAYRTVEKKASTRIRVLSKTRSNGKFAKIRRSFRTEQSKVKHSRRFIKIQRRKENL